MGQLIEAEHQFRLKGAFTQRKGIFFTRYYNRMLGFDIHQEVAPREIPKITYLPDRRTFPPSTSA